MFMKILFLGLTFRGGPEKYQRDPGVPIVLSGSL